MKININSSRFLHPNLIEPLINLGKAEDQAKCHITVNIDYDYEEITIPNTKTGPTY
uniref:Uncharacterized protein n=1 Tax=viral metagenome TaxID=1070528 RepID=A0A6H1ZNY3_9ZZZZ